MSKKKLSTFSNKNCGVCIECARKLSPYIYNIYKHNYDIKYFYMWIYIYFTKDAEYELFIATLGIGLADTK